MRRHRLIPAAALFLVAIAAGACADPGAGDTAPRPRATVDRLVPVGAGGPRLHLRCTGTGSSTVVLVAGFGDAGDGWGAVTPAISGRARVCSYTRFGLGTSDAPPRDQTFETEATDLHELLRVAGEPGPYVVVGHSFGGAEAVTFTARYRDEVEGLLLLDASPPGWPAAVCAVPDDGSDTAAGFRQTCATLSGAGANPERLDAMRAFAQTAAIRSLGDVPMVVATRADLSHPGLAPAADANLAHVWRAGQAHWASLSPSARLVTVADSGHYLQIDQPAAVIDAIRSLVARRPQI